MIQSKKILHIIVGLNNGGAEAVLYRLAAADTRRGNTHVVISMMDRGLYAERLERAGVEVHCLNMPRGKFGIAALPKLYRLLQSIRPDVVQTWMYHADLIGGVMARLAGISAVSWGIRHANLDPAQNGRSTVLVAKLCARLSGLIPGKIISCSEQAVKVHHAIGYEETKFVTIANGYELEIFKTDFAAAASVRRELDIADTQLVFGMVARFDHQKDHANLMSALGLLKKSGLKFVCILVGTGMDAGNLDLAALIKDADLLHNVRLLGPRNDIPAIMNALDIHVLSSLGEAFPNVLAEAMACGTPCVTTDVGDAALIVGPYGWVVPARSPQALADALRAASKIKLDNPDEWEELKISCGKHIASHFEMSKMVDAYRRVWCELLLKNRYCISPA